MSLRALLSSRASTQYDLQLGGSNAAVRDGEPCSSALFCASALARLCTARIAISRRIRGCSLLYVSFRCLELESFEEMLIRASSRCVPYPGRSRSRAMGAAGPLSCQHSLDLHFTTHSKTRGAYTRATADCLARTRRKFVQIFPFSLETSTLTLLSRAGPHFRTVLGFTLSPRGESELASARLAGELVRPPLP